MEYTFGIALALLLCAAARARFIETSASALSWQILPPARDLP